MNVDLTLEEAEELLKDADADGNGLLDGAEFLLMFFREAHEERSKVAHKVQAARREVAAAAKLEKEEENKRDVDKDAGAFSSDFEPADTQRALRRLAEYARTFDVLSEDGKRTSANFSCVLRPAALKEQLLKSFGMKTTRRELGALIAHFDQDGDGDVSGAEFMVTFNKLGTLARNKERKRIVDAIRRKKERGLLAPLKKSTLGR